MAGFLFGFSGCLGCCLHRQPENGATGFNFVETCGFQAAVSSAWAWAMCRMTRMASVVRARSVFQSAGFSRGMMRVP
ncbi:MAG: hypothetical protein ACFNS8_06380 [Kingella oralis]